MFFSTKDYINCQKKKFSTGEVGKMRRGRVRQSGTFAMKTEHKTEH